MLQENLWNTHRSSWMKVKDLSFVEQRLIPPIERLVPEMNRFCGELMQSAVDNQAAEAAKKDAQARGEVGLPKVNRKAGTVPISPRLTQTRPPILPQPERINAEIIAKPVPSFIERTNLAKIANKRAADKLKIKTLTTQQYSDNKVFKFHDVKAEIIRPIEEIRAEIEVKRNKELQFDASFYHEPPDFSKQNVSFKENSATILREDYLYRKQQAKDATILRNYEEELRDPTEYYLWQQEMRDYDETEKLKYVALRREQAKQSAEEAKAALERQQRDNAAIATLVRQQGEAIKRKKEVEHEIEVLQKQQTVQNIISDRETKPQEALQRVLEQHEAEAKRIREELDIARQKKEAEDAAEELIKADKIRQLRAFNTVHKKHITVFDPTDTAGIGLLDEMSYMEMKVRQAQERAKQAELVQLKKEEIEVEKTKKALDLERRSGAILRARQLKAEANQQLRVASKQRKQREIEAIEQARQIAASQWDQEVKHRNAVKKAEHDALVAEQERIARQQQYLGAAQGQVAAMREQQLEMAKERQLRQLATETQQSMQLDVETSAKENKNKVTLYRHQRQEHSAQEAAREAEVEFENRARMQKMKQGVLYKKHMFAEGQQQHERTKVVLTETNPYGARISEEIRTMATSNKMMRSGSAGRIVE